jgi:hypothetical protein
MQAPYLSAQIFGIGQLITQRKKLIVPEHQRDYSWTIDEVGQFLDDMTTAFNERTDNYFIGLIVLLGPKDNSWIILDGQQRLATTTIIYSSIRQWLSDRNFEADARQIDTEFLRARMLGGELSPRLVLNDGNRKAFDESVIQSCSDARLNSLLEASAKFSSNRLLFEAVQACRDYISKFGAENLDLDQQKESLFRFAAFLENGIEAVVADVSSESNAYVISESLNARGNDLSILDLLKNFVFGMANAADVEAIRECWALTTQRIEDKEADDFLKTFWTSRFGRIQSQQLYGRIKNKFSTSEQVVALMQDLVEVSEHYIALDDASHEVWFPFGKSCRQQVETLSLLGSKQIRAPILSAIVRFDAGTMGFLLKCLITLTVRYQSVGKRRTGLLEIASARLANRIYRREVMEKHDILDELLPLMPTDEEFHSDFLKFSEKKASRLTYLLVQLELSRRTLSGASSSDLEELTIPRPFNATLHHILPKRLLAQSLGNDLTDQWFDRIANYVLLEDDEHVRYDKINTYEDLMSDLEVFSTSDLILSKEIEPRLGSARTLETFLILRQENLAGLAVESWPIPNIE